MSLITLLFWLILFTAVAIYVNRRIQARLAANAAAQTDAQPKQSWLSNWLWPQPKDRTPAFRAWAATAFAGQPALQQWLAALPDEGVQALTARLVDFCWDLEFEFDWLLAQTVEQDSSLAPRLHVIVRHYIQACYQATLVQDEVALFRSWQDFTRNPSNKAQQAVAQQVLTQLLADGVLPPAARNWQVAQAAEQEAQLVQAVQAALAQQPNAFYLAWKRTLSTPDGLADTPPLPATADMRTPPQRRPASAAQPLANGQVATPTG